MINITEKALETIQEEIEFLTGIEEDNLEFSDMGLVLFVRKQSCSPMTEGGHLEIGVAVEPKGKYENNSKYKVIDTLKELGDLPIFIEDQALEMIGERSTIEIDSRGALEKELLIRNGPIKDLGSCEVRIKRK